MTIVQKPSSEFSDVIEKFWLMPRKGRPGWWELEAPPDGSFDLVFVLSESRCKIIYVGPFTRLQRLPMASSCDYFCVWFRPGIMPRLADVSAGELIDTWADLPVVLGASADELGEKLAAARGMDGKRKLIEDFFRRANLASAVPDGPYRRAARLIEASRGRIRVQALAGELGMTTRTLERMFREHAGLSPKKFTRLVRFNQILSRLRSGADRSTLVDLAYDWGYTDQSHFIRDFKSLMQTPPGRI
jgi:AraC-like DNA-binding protein